MESTGPSDSRGRPRYHDRASCKFPFIIHDGKTYLVCTPRCFHWSVRTLFSLKATVVPSLFPSLFKTSASQRASSLEALFTLKCLIRVGTIRNPTSFPVAGSVLGKYMRPR